MARPAKVFKVWTILLSAVFAVLLFPSIVNKHGFWLSLFFTSAGIGIIWIVYFAIGRLMDWVSSEELKRRNLNRQQEKHNKTLDDEIH